MVPTVLFDLDDTLYPERAFVQSGFRAVAHHLSERHGVDPTVAFARMWTLLEQHGRGHVFDTLVAELGLPPNPTVPTLLYVYRTHRPSLALFPDAEETLRTLAAEGARTGIVTDGMASVQRRKLEALGLPRLVDLALCTDELGPSCWKPSTLPFEVALALLGSLANHAVYVGNDPRKDFCGPAKLGMTTIEVRWPSVGPPPLDDSAAPPLVHAQYVTTNLRDVLALLRGHALGSP